MTAGLECNIEDTFSKFCDMTATEMNRAVRRALRSGAQELRKQTRANALSGMNSRNNPAWYDGKRITYDDNVEDAVRLSKIEGGFDTELSQKVHVMGTRKSGSQTYKFRFLEKGTKQRYANNYRNRNGELKRLKQPKKLGQITGRRWFQAAQQAVFPQLDGIYIREIEKAVNKLNNERI